MRLQIVGAALSHTTHIMELIWFPFRREFGMRRAYMNAWPAVAEVGNQQTAEQGQSLVGMVAA